VPTGLAAGGFGWQLKIPIFVLGTSAIFGGFLLSGPIPGVIVLGSFDKALPLICIALGAYAGMRVRNVKENFFSGIWNLTPLAQQLSHTAVPALDQQQFDGGWVELGGGFGGANMFITMQALLYPFVGVGLVGFWLLVV
jgi:hypothetical protein